MLGNRTSSEWIAQYSGSHQHPVNRFCHTIGIPLIAVSLLLFAAALFAHRLWRRRSRASSPGGYFNSSATRLRANLPSS
jgi:hypothetical protein